MARNIENDRKLRAKYLKDKTQLFAVRFNKAADKDIIEYLETCPSKVDAFREGIRLAIKMSHK